MSHAYGTYVLQQGAAALASHTFPGLALKPVCQGVLKLAFEAKHDLPPSMKFGLLEKRLCRDSFVRMASQLLCGIFAIPHCVGRARTVRGICIWA